MDQVQLVLVLVLGHLSVYEGWMEVYLLELRSVRQTRSVQVSQVSQVLVSTEPIKHSAAAQVKPAATPAQVSVGEGGSHGNQVSQDRQASVFTAGCLFVCLLGLMCLNFKV